MRGGPAELSLGAVGQHDLAVEIARPRRRVDDLDVAEQFLDVLRDLLDRHVLVAGEVVDAVLGDVAEPERDPLGEILDVHEPARLAAVAGERQRLALQRLVHERRDHGGLARAGTVGDAEPEDRVVDPVQLLIGLAVQLAGQLRARVEV